MHSYSFKKRQDGQSKAMQSKVKLKETSLLWSHLELRCLFMNSLEELAAHELTAIGGQ